LIGISWIGEIQVELIQPVYGPMIYEAFIQKHGEGLHHFKERVSQDDIDEVIKEYKEKRHRGDADKDSSERTFTII